jgi:hypothetical protein
MSGRPASHRRLPTTRLVGEDDELDSRDAVPRKARHLDGAQHAPSPS